MLVYLHGTPTWRPENSVNIWNLLGLSRSLIIRADQANIKISTFVNSLTSSKAKNPETSPVEPRYFQVPREMQKKFEIAGF